MIAIFKREFASYFKSPVGYVAIAIFSFLSGLMFYSQFVTGSVDIGYEVMSLRSFFIIIVPIITMGLLSEDKKRGTDILYYTTPVDLFSVVGAKLLASFSLLAIMFINVFIHIIVVKICGGVVSVGCIGNIVIYFFMGFMFIAIGLFTSAITDNQIISAIVSFIIILFSEMISQIGTYIGSAVNVIFSAMGATTLKASNAGYTVANAISWFDPFIKTEDFSIGIFSVSALIYVFSIGIVFLYLTYRVLEKKRWSQA